MQPSSMLDDLAVHFVRPARSGVYLTKNELIVLARLSDASLRINERWRMLADVLKSAQSAADLASLFDRLIAFCQGSIDDYTEMAREYPSCAPQLRGFQENALRTIERLSAARQELSLEDGDLEARERESEEPE